MRNESVFCESDITAISSNPTELDSTSTRPLRSGSTARASLPASIDNREIGSRIPLGPIGDNSTFPRDGSAWQKSVWDISGRRDNRHFSLGQKPHFCLRNVLARHALMSAHPALFTRFTDFALAMADEDIGDMPSCVIRCPAILPVSFRDTSQKMEGTYA
ncbi:hypothetical protein [Lonsdalea quercina]|uniref:hypothetical protein n=1 Tax=Lonsdalea quercina TaxID=71657 RepID=UPI0039760CAE